METINDFDQGFQNVRWHCTCFMVANRTMKNGKARLKISQTSTGLIDGVLGKLDDTSKHYFVKC